LTTGRTLVDGFDAVQLADLERGPTTYRVFLLPEALQLDLSMTPAAQFRPAAPRFRLVFGETAAGEFETPVAGGLFILTPPAAGDIFGWGVIYALHARACIERGRVWQAEHYVGAVREVSVIFGAVAGWKLLGEPMGPTRVVGAVIIFIGAMCIVTLG
jgi:hypothetical protein